MRSTPLRPISLLFRSIDAYLNGPNIWQWRPVELSVERVDNLNKLLSSSQLHPPPHCAYAAFARQSACRRSDKRR